MTKPVLVNTLSWGRSEIVTIPGELWEHLTQDEKFSIRKQTGEDGKILGKITVNVRKKILGKIIVKVRSLSEEPSTVLNLICLPNRPRTIICMTLFHL